jgi:hypothetical protein
VHYFHLQVANKSARCFRIYLISIWMICVNSRHFSLFLPLGRYFKSLVITSKFVWWIIMWNNEIFIGLCITCIAYKFFILPCSECTHIFIKLVTLIIFLFNRKAQKVISCDFVFCCHLVYTYYRWKIPCSEICFYSVL